MEQSSNPGVAIKYENKLIFRNVRPVDEIVKEFEEKEILHAAIDPADMKYGSWNVVIAFSTQESYDQYKAGDIKFSNDWITGGASQERRVNPLKASKRAAGN